MFILKLFNCFVLTIVCVVISFFTLYCKLWWSLVVLSRIGGMRAFVSVCRAVMMFSVDRFNVV